MLVHRHACCTCACMLPHARVQACTCVCVRSCTCGLYGAGGAEVSELPGTAEGAQSTGLGGGNERDGFSLPFSSRRRFLTRRLGKPGPSKAAIMSPASLRAAWHKGLSPAGWGPELKEEPSG